MADINMIFNFILDMFRSIWAVYTGSFILASVIALFLFRKVVNWFRNIT